MLVASRGGVWGTFSKTNSNIRTGSGGGEKKTLLPKVVLVTKMELTKWERLGSGRSNGKFWILPLRMRQLIHIIKTV